MPLSVEITTPFGSVYQGPADMVIVPAVEGELGILPGHTPYLAVLDMGIMRIKNGDSTEYFSAAGGFVEINPHRVVILCETCENARNIDAARAETDRLRLVEQLRHSDQGADLTHTELSLRKSLLRLKTVKKIADTTDTHIR